MLRSVGALSNARRFIRQTKGGYVVHSEKGKKLSKVYKSKTEAVRRLRQIEYFKHRKG